MRGQGVVCHLGGMSGGHYTQGSLGCWNEGFITDGFSIDSPFPTRSYCMNEGGKEKLFECANLNDLDTWPIS